jgi:hypothetical protein
MVIVQVVKAQSRTGTRSVAWLHTRDFHCVFNSSAVYFHAQCLLDR